jgi:hypothetical protein
MSQAEGRPGTVNLEGGRGADGRRPLASFRIPQTADTVASDS